MGLCTQQQALFVDKSFSGLLHYLKIFGLKTLMLENSHNRLLIKTQQIINVLTKERCQSMNYRATFANHLQLYFSLDYFLTSAFFPQSFDVIESMP